MTTPRERLLEAMKKRRLSRNEFAKQMRHQFAGEFRGLSRPSVLNYLRGERDPSPKWWDAAALLVGVMPRWLRLGEGPREHDGPWMSPGPSSDGLASFQSLLDAKDELRVRCQFALQEWQHVPAEAFTAITRFLEELYIRTGPPAFGVRSEDEWRGRASMEKHGRDMPVSAGDIGRYAGIHFGPVFRWDPDGDRWAVIAATHALLSALYLTSFSE